MNTMKKRSIMIRVMAVLSVVMMFTICFVGGTFAKYTTGDSGDDSARVAKWGVTVAGTADTFKETYSKNDNSFANCNSKLQ